MKHVLIDTDVLLDTLLLREPFSQNAIQIIKECELGRLEGFITPVILANAYYIMRKHFQDDSVRLSLKRLLRIINVIQINKSEILQALNSDFKDFEVALQNYSAENSDVIDIILTRNIKDYKHSKLVVMTPELFLSSPL
jgi:predicted nucleic acid-binding protein